MEFETLVSERRSIREFAHGVKVSKEDIVEMVKCSQLAPSWKNSQTARYYAALSDEAFEKVEKCLPEFNRNSSKNAAALIVTTYVKNRSGFERDGNPTNELGNAWGAYDLGLANENLILKAKELGYDSLIMGIRNEAGIREIFDISDNEAVVSVIAIGKRNINPDMPPRKDVDAVLKVF